MSRFAVSALACLFSIQLWSAEITRVRVLVLADENAKKISEITKIDGAIAEGVFRHIFDNPDFASLRGKASIQVMKAGTILGPGAIYEHLKHRPVRQDEAIVIYYSGHGGYDNRTKGGHYLAMSGGDMSRWELRSLFEEAPLLVFMTDACASFGDFDGAPASQPDSRELKKREALYRDLFFNYRGVVDFNSSSIGEYSWTAAGGSIMTQALAHVLVEKPLEDLDFNQDGLTTWDDLFLHIRSETEARFQASRESAIELANRENLPLPEIASSQSQRPYLFARPSRTENNILGAHVRHGVLRGNEEGLVFDLSFRTDLPVGTTLNVGVLFLDDRGKLLKDFDGKFTTKTADVTISRQFVLDKSPFYARGWEPFIPYPQLHLEQLEKGSKVHALAYVMQAGDKDAFLFSEKIPLN